MQTPTSDNPWTRGDKLTHAGKPEWGTGVVTAIDPVTIDGKGDLRLTIRFERAGVRKLVAGLADLRPADASRKFAAAASEAATAAALGVPDASKLAELLRELPEAARDPFASLASRFRVTLDLYRFTGQAGSLLDWAAMQTGLADPLSSFSRHDLESHFARFRRTLDDHARTLGLEIARTDPAAASQIVAAAPDEAKAAMRRVAARR
ncbi:MAG: DUF3553 domain-containing protein [Planctomycetota bacterium]